MCDRRLKTGDRLIEISAIKMNSAKGRISVAELRMSIDQLLQHVHRLVIPTEICQHDRGPQLRGPIAGTGGRGDLCSIKLSIQPAPFVVACGQYCSAK